MYTLVYRHTRNQKASVSSTAVRWGDVWPAARTFHPAVVPLPVSFAVDYDESMSFGALWNSTELVFQ